MSDEDWKQYHFTQQVEFQPWKWAKRWPWRLWIKPKKVSFDISFWARTGGEASVAKFQAEAYENPKVWPKDTAIRSACRGSADTSP